MFEIFSGSDKLLLKILIHRFKICLLHKYLIFQKDLLKKIFIIKFLYILI